MLSEEPVYLMTDLYEMFSNDTTSGVASTVAVFEKIEFGKITSPGVLCNVI